MHPNKYWLLFLLLVGSLALWQLSKAGLACYTYARISRALPVEEIFWYIEQSGSSDYHLKASVKYFFENKLYACELERAEKYRNPLMAQEVLAELQAKPHQIWIDPHHPNEAVMERSFPAKELVYTAVLALLALYFLALGFFVKTQSKVSR